MSHGDLRVGLVGASGFIGRAVARALETRGADAVAINGRDPSHTWPDFTPLRSVINCAGLADATSLSALELNQANALLPETISRHARQAGVRFVHVSSAAVQGRIAELDSSETYSAFSPYSRSKVLGEHLVARVASNAVTYRPPGVHAADRAVTQRIARLAARELAVVSQHEAPSPQALLENVADAIAFLATTPATPPRIVHHPSEGVTTSTFLYHLGGKPPHRVPHPLAKLAVSGAFLIGRLIPAAAGQARRAEVLMLGQRVAPSWLTDAGWVPTQPLGDAWAALGREARSLNREQR